MAERARGIESLMSGAQTASVPDLGDRPERLPRLAVERALDFEAVAGHRLDEQRAGGRRLRKLDREQSAAVSQHQGAIELLPVAAFGSQRALEHVSRDPDRAVYADFAALEQAPVGGGLTQPAAEGRDPDRHRRQHEEKRPEGPRAHSRET